MTKHKPRSRFVENGACVFGGSYRDRTDDLLGVNELLYQLS